ncbi:MAG: hypothetical protein U0L17_04070 [Acutalibacteraceae bacterium]|nr:hypothetical protein [Acutalibacteraceae bacterium]
MKRVLSIFILILLVVGIFSVVPASANANTEMNTETEQNTSVTTASVTTTKPATTKKPVHVHKCKWVTTKKATLKKTGKKVYKCTSCGKITKTATVAKLKKLSTPKNVKISVKYVKTPSDTCYDMMPRVTVKFDKVKNATGYKIQYKYEKWKNYKTKVVKNNSYTFISFGNYNSATKYSIKVAATTDKEGYANSSYTKAKTVKVKEIKMIDICPKCNWKKGEGKGYCETFVGEGYCFHCGKFVPDDTCHHCTVSNKVKNFYKYDFDSGKTWADIMKELKKNK